MPEQVEVCVKNTFIDVKEEQPDLRRTKTASAAERSVGGLDDDSDDASPAAQSSPVSAFSKASGRSGGYGSRLKAPLLRKEDDCEGGLPDRKVSEVMDLPFGDAVHVKNTFIEFVDDSLPMPELRRTQTAPVGRRPGAEDESEEEDDDEEDEDGTAPLPQPQLVKQQTRDLFESGDEWSWTDRLPPPRMPPRMTAAAPAPGPTVAPQLSTGSVPAPGGYVVVPIPLMLPVGNQTVHVQQPLRGARYPPPPPSEEAPPSIGNSPVGADEDLPPPPETEAVVTPSASDFETTPETCKSLELDAEAAARVGLKTTGGPPAPSPSMQQPLLSRTKSTRSGHFRVNWTVAARVLKSKDTKAVSPPFEVDLGDGSAALTFKIMLIPQATNEGRGGASFKKAKGRGKVTMKCESDCDLPDQATTLSFRISVGQGAGRMELPRGPISHNFKQHATAGLLQEEEIWDFASAADEATTTFVVCIEFVPVMTLTSSGERVDWADCDV
eukprot:TRINITY_DN111494_c0_g1_i1.p1 TRINITY_DN111494_c0_g1~~TRINITY_DN111494_c0_g1_i1.p1  ORF type:complete len:496 (-),score=130.09 TRINITY_DN111494_c0_g1_i1:126-1613(-)